MEYEYDHEEDYDGTGKGSGIDWVDGKLTVVNRGAYERTLATKRS